MKCREGCKGFLDTGRIYLLKVRGIIEEKFAVYVCGECERVHSILGRLFFNPAEGRHRPLYWRDGAFYYKESNK